MCDTKAVWVENGSQTKPKFFVIVANFPPDAASAKINHLVRLVETVSEAMRNTNNIILVGDSNFSNIQWEQNKKNEQS